MRETDKNIQDEVKTSLLAIASFVLSTFLLMMLAPWFFPVSVTSDMLDSIFCFGPFLSFCTAVLGIAALIQRICVLRRLWWLGIVGIAVPVAWVVTMFIWICCSVTGWH